MDTMIDTKALLKECSGIQSYLEISVSDDPAELAERLSMLCVYMARTGQMLADAKYVQDTQRSGLFAEHSKTIVKMPATIAARFIDSLTGEVNYLVTWTDRLNRTCVHQSDALRTLLSFSKEQLRMTKTGY